MINFRYLFLLAVVLLFFDDAELLRSTSAATAPNQAPVSPAKEIIDLGNQRYKIGNIVVNKAEQYFEVSGRVIRREPPLEFLAVTVGGKKGYESLFELDASAIHFNLACILIGLDEKKGKPPKMHFDTEPTQGDIVTINVTVNRNGKEKTYTAAEMLVDGSKVVKDNNWAFTGSSFWPDGKYAAEMDGTLIGFVHDPSSIIEHKMGVGIGDYGAVGANRNIVPEVGGKILLKVKKVTSE